MGVLKSSFIAAAVLLLNACNSNSAQQPEQEATVTATPVSEKQPETTTKGLPQFSMLDAAGNVRDLQRFKGKKVLVNLWATWCPPCRAEMPSIEKLYKGLDTAHVQFVLLSLDKDFETAKKYVQKNSLQLPVYFPAGDLPDMFAVNGIPTTFIFNEAGDLIAQREGSEDYNTAAYRQLFGAVK